MRDGGDVVVGGGLGGLSAALRLARGGRQVTLVERSSHLGGRATTRRKDGFDLNLGAHAMYPAAAELLAELGVTWTGAKPAARGFAARGEALHTLPVGLVSMLTTGLFGVAEKYEVAKLFAALPRLDAAALDATPVREWVDAGVTADGSRRFVEALVRVTTYANAPAHQSAGRAVALLQRVLETNVTYLDGGWQGLIDQLADAAEGAGVRIVRGARVVGLERVNGLHAVRLDDETSLSAEHVLLALSPHAAAELTGSTALSAWAARVKPAKAACLDVALSALPRPRATFALGIDRPLYLSVHSATARIAPDGAAMIHLAKYLDPDVESEPAHARAELEALLDRVQPGWREHVVHARFLPNLVVAHAIPLAAEEGDAGRPPTALAAGVFLVGDWVGRGHLAEASLASAKQAAELVLARGAAHAAAA